MRGTQLFREWQAADRAACAAEKAVLADSLRSADTMGNSPAVYHMEKAKRRRAVANEIFQLAMDAINPPASVPSEHQSVAADLCLQERRQRTP